MEKSVFPRITGSILILAILVSGCASSTVLRTIPPDADVYVKGQRLGTTPYTHKDRKIIGASTLVTFKKEGYEDYLTTIRKDKKLNIGALISGLFFIYPLFWIMGYAETYSYDLEKAEISTRPVAVAEPAKTEVAARVATVKDLPDSIDLPKSTRVEKLLSEGQIDKAVEYAKDQEGAFQAGCYYAIAQYYLDNKNLQAAEDFFNRSGRVKEGNVRIAEALMRGEVKDSTVVIDEKKIKIYLEKVYESDAEITVKMAACYEKYADESKEQIELAKKLKDVGMISMSRGGKTINIDRSMTLSRVLAIFYLNSAINAYEELNNTEKVQELRNESEVISEDLLRQAVSSKQTPADETTVKVQTTISNNKRIRVDLNEMRLTAEDERVVITVDSIVRTSTRPKDLVNALEATNNSLKSWPNPNSDYVLVYFSRTVKKDLNLTSKEQSSANVSLISDQALNNYSLVLERGSNYVNIPGGGRLWFNPDLPTYQAISNSEKYDGVIINYSYMMFYMPVNSTPVQLNYLYNYKNDANDKKTTTGTLTINLTQ